MILTGWDTMTQGVLVSVSAVMYTRIIILDRALIVRSLICICREVSEIPLCVLQQTLLTNNRPHAAGLPDANKKQRTQ